MDGKVFERKDYEVGVTAPPFHPNCRTTTVPYFDDEFSDVETRAAKDPVTGKSMEVPADMTYRQWQEQFVENDPRAVLAEKMQKNEGKDRKQYETYKEILEKEAPKTLDAFQKLKYNDGEEWKSIQQNYSDTNRYHKLVVETGNLNIKGKLIKKIDRIDLSEFTFREAHINVERSHAISKEQAQQYIKNSIAAYSRWNGQVTVYVSEEGAVVVNHQEKSINTAYSSKEYDMKFNRLLEVLGIDTLSPGK